MNIKQEKEQNKNAMTAYFTKDQFGNYKISIEKQRPIFLMGAPGIGKSTLASQFPNPLFIDTEGGTAHMDVRRISKPESFDELIDIVQEVAKEPNICP